MARTLDQKIAETEKRLASLRQKVRANDTRQKIVVGAIAISAALSHRMPLDRFWLPSKPRPSGIMIKPLLQGSSSDCGVWLRACRLRRVQLRNCDEGCR